MAKIDIQKTNITIVGNWNVAIMWQSYHISSNTKMVTFNYNRDSGIKEEVKSFINDFKKHYEDAQNILNKLLGK